MQLWKPVWKKVRTGFDEGSYIGKRGNCESFSEANLLSHLAINIFSTLLLASSNYCMQIAIAPTRQDLDEVHSKNRWLDIGVSSLRNLRWVSAWRKILWTLLCISSLPLHLFYNSSIFASQVATEYLVAELDESFLESGSGTTLTNITLEGALDNGGRPGIQLSTVLDTFETMLEHLPLGTISAPLTVLDSTINP